MGAGGWRQEGPEREVGRDSAHHGEPDVEAHQHPGDAWLPGEVLELLWAPCPTSPSSAPHFRLPLIRSVAPVHCTQDGAFVVPNEEDVLVGP